ncbi:dimethylaniline monooxygenase [N-oxide-forming] 5 [Biomphalaria glabrata]|uniref:Flavin-containing monooxygenase n=1 Tax=Biomphalaria glabrata TaxID=6526 RepID=A0A9W2Z2G6_BIOGL|nr:flavin-containing monooxygenase 5-like [Biomphalaria glabrata]XP_055869134.1 flavin-containing monooxygenase 5-like [Biomphalaria glabrata]KAI8751122.1 dimethylaniline monooxygenase [N-oxide-forming] 5-like [Biomphalaria glabrata]KAI8772429.1 dimethylaniline monooxygenase [N-oxide-forming] 5 [Biomphalaria glabrata]
MTDFESDVVVLGAGVSGLVTAKCLLEDGFKVCIIEKTSDIGGLWTYREKDYGVMKCTHINVSKYNYAFSDFPFPDDVPDYPHHSDMAKYIKDYANKFQLLKLIHFNTKIIGVDNTDGKWVTRCCKVDEDGKEDFQQMLIFTSSYVAVATGHHAKPNFPSFEGADTFRGKTLHAVSYKDPSYNDCAGQRVLIVGIGNSAVDVAVDCATIGRCPDVTISTRSGAWVIPNYIFGLATDLYACRFFFLFPRSIANFIMSLVIMLVSGSPWRWGLNPKMKPLQTQPTVSPTLIHHIQRGNIKIKPNILNIRGNTVKFVDGTSAKYDRIVYCTGYTIDLPFLSSRVMDSVLQSSSNKMQLYKNVFAPYVGHSLAFIGFVQPASGGIITMSEMQARWFSKLCKGEVKLPNSDEMSADIENEKKIQSGRWYQTARHTLQKDPIVYNDEIGEIIGAKPKLFQNPLLTWRLIFSSGGASQWRLNGPNTWQDAAKQVRKVPVPFLWNLTGYFVIFGFLVIVSLFMKCLCCC